MRSTRTSTQERRLKTAVRAGLAAALLALGAQAPVWAAGTLIDANPAQSRF